MHPMEILITAALVFALVGGVAMFFSIYNSLVALKNNIGRACANIDVLLKQRHDEIPKLVEICRQYRQFEQETLEKVVRARSAVRFALSTRGS